MSMRSSSRDSVPLASLSRKTKSSLRSPVGSSEKTSKRAGRAGAGKTASPVSFTVSEKRISKSYG